MSRRVGEGGAPRVARGMAVLGAIGLALCVLGAVLDPRRAAFSYLAAYAAVLSLVLGALSLQMIAHVTGARWLEPLLPLARATAGTLPVMAVLFLPVVVGMHALYPWVPPLSEMSAVARAHVLDKAAYLNVPFFLVRAAVYFAVWIALAELLGRGDGVARRRWSAVGLPPFGFAVTFAAIDWIMSLLPEWWSTIFGLYFWSGGFLAALAGLAVLAPGVVAAGADPATAAGARAAAASTPSARSNTLGKLVLTFVLFWAYVGFSQFLVIWIGDVPIESSWLAPRLTGGWGALGAILLAGQFAIPFALLLPRHNRERPRTLAAIGGWLLLMHYLDACWLVLPALPAGGTPAIWLDVAALAGIGGVTSAFGSWRLGRFAPELARAEAEAVAWW